MRVLVLVAVAFAVVPGVATPAELSRLPNIVLILTDDLGINDLGVYGRRDHATPNLDRLASEGIRFTSAYSAAPVCSPSRAALLTARAPARLHLTTFLPGRPDTPAQKLLHPVIRQQLPLEEQTLAEILRDRGYATACIGKWHLGGSGFGPREQGFDVAFAGRANTTPSEIEGGKGEYELTEQAIRFVEQNRGRPFFLLLSHNNPHIPLAAQARLIEKNREAFNPVYAAMIETLDDSVGRLLEKINEFHLGDDTIVVFTSDNGGLHVPELREDPSTHNTPFRAGKGFLYEGGIRVPLLVRWPGRIGAGRTTAEPVINTDVMPTLLELAGIPVPRDLDGVSFARLVLGKGAPKPRPLLWHFPHYSNQGSRPSGAIREGNWKFIQHYEDGRTELFNLASDPSEQTNLSRTERTRSADLLEKLESWLKKIGAQRNHSNPSFDAGLHRQLYVDTDVSNLKPADRASRMTPALASWRAQMDNVVPKAGSPPAAAQPRP